MLFITERDYAINMGGDASLRICPMQSHRSHANRSLPHMSLPVLRRILVTVRLSDGGWPTAERLASFAPWVLVGYTLLQCLIRFALSSNLEPDEAQFVGQVDFRWGYDNSQGPLYNWLVGLVLNWSGSWPVSVVVTKHFFLAATFVLQYDLVRRLTGSAVAAAASAFALLLIPQIVVISEITLAHTVMVQAAVVATLHALVLIFERGSVGRFLWLGIALSTGILAKYNFLLVIMAIVAVTLSVAEIRQRLLSPKLLAPTAVVAATCGPHLLWALDNRASVVERLSKMSERNDLFYLVDAPTIGIDGLLALLWGVAVALLPLYGCWRLATGFARPTQLPTVRVGMSEPAVRHLLLVSWLAPISVFALFVLALDAHDVRLRYVTPLILSFPSWIGLVWPVAHDPVAARRIITAGGVFAAIVAVAWPVSVMTTRGPLNYPYGEMAASIAATAQPPYAIIGPAGIDQNLVARIDGATLWNADNPANRVLVVARGDKSPDEMARRLGETYVPIGEVGKASFRRYYFVDRMESLSWQLFGG